MNVFRFEATTPVVHHGGWYGEPGRRRSYELTTGGDLLFGCGLLIQPLGLWVGAHYSRHNRRWCVNLLPCVTLWVALPGGKAP